MAWLENIVRKAFLIEGRQKTREDAIAEGSAVVVLYKLFHFGGLTREEKLKVGEVSREHRQKRNEARGEYGSLNREYLRRVDIAKVVWFGSAVVGVGIAAARILGGW